MPQKIVFVQGSPRKNGNTRAVAAVAMQAAQDKGAAVDEIDATRLKFKKPGCTGCQKCQQSDAFLCVIDDEITQAVATLPGYDVIVMATPLYWWSFSAQIKMVIDRMYSLTKFTESGDVRSAISSKVLALMATGGGPLEGNLELLERQWENPAEVLGCRFLSSLFPFAPWEPGAITADPAVTAQAKAFGNALAALGKTRESAA